MHANSLRKATAFNQQRTRETQSSQARQSQGMKEMKKSGGETPHYKVAAQHRLTTLLRTSRYTARFAQSRGRSLCSVWPRLPMPCMAVSIHVS